MTLRSDVVQERLRMLREVVANLATLQAVPRQEFISSFRHYWLAERGLQLAAEILLDIGNHILAGMFQSSSATYEDIPRELADHGVISQQLSLRLRGLGGFRTILVHHYLKVDRGLLYRYIHDELDCFEVYSREIEEFVV